MYCSKCGKKIADNSNFCYHCGTKVEDYIKNDYTTSVFEPPTTDGVLFESTEVEKSISSSALSTEFSITDKKLESSVTREPIETLVMENNCVPQNNDIVEAKVEPVNLLEVEPLERENNTESQETKAVGVNVSKMEEDSAPPKNNDVIEPQVEPVTPLGTEPLKKGNNTETQEMNAGGIHVFKIILWLLPLLIFGGIKCYSSYLESKAKEGVLHYMEKTNYPTTLNCNTPQRLPSVQKWKIQDSIQEIINNIAASFDLGLPLEIEEDLKALKCEPYGHALLFTYQMNNKKTSQFTNKIIEKYKKIHLASLKSVRDTPEMKYILDELDRNIGLFMYKYVNEKGDSLFEVLVSPLEIRNDFSWQE